MNREGWKVFFASALGAGIGAFVALEIVSWFWWIGLIVGGLVGYLSYEFKAVLAALPKAYRAVRGWQTPPHYWAAVIWEFSGSMSLMIWLVAVIASISLIASDAPIADVFWFIGAMGALLGFIMFLATMKSVAQIAKKKGLYDDTLDGRRFAYCVFPPIVIFYHLPRGLWWVIRRTPRAVAVAAIAVGHGLLAFVRFVPRFFWQVFVRIHSEMRILCGTDAMLGVAVGYFAGSALLGAAVGGLFGVVNYALVTERWLRPQGYLPARPK